MSNCVSSPSEICLWYTHTLGQLLKRNNISLKKIFFLKHYKAAIPVCHDIERVQFSERRCVFIGLLNLNCNVIQPECVSVQSESVEKSLFCTVDVEITKYFLLTCQCVKENEIAISCEHSPDNSFFFNRNFVCFLCIC